MVEALHRIAPVLVPVAAVLLTADLLWAFATWDRLIKLEFQHDPEAGSKNGKPLGLFQRRPLAQYASYGDWSRARWSRGLLMFGWLFSTPAWARRDPEASGLLVRLRLLVVIWSLGFLLALMVAAIASALHWL